MRLTARATHATTNEYDLPQALTNFPGGGVNESDLLSEPRLGQLEQPGRPVWSSPLRCHALIPFPACAAIPAQPHLCRLRCRAWQRPGPGWLSVCAHRPPSAAWVLYCACIIAAQAHLVGCPRALPASCKRAHTLSSRVQGDPFRSRIWRC